jgi:hypothetical protein
VLLLANADLSEAERRELSGMLESRHGKVKVISVEDNPRAVIVKTTNEVAPQLRSSEEPLMVRGKALTAVLTSGAIGKLKRQASGAQAHGQVPQR